MTKQILTQDYIKSFIDYNPETGIFTNKRTGNIIGSGINDRGYKIIKINRHPYRAHRIAFLWMTGEIPDIIDHINRVRSDNRWCNLRESNHTHNAWNSTATRAVSGERNIHSSNNTLWTVNIRHNGKFVSKSFPKTDEGLSQAILWRDSKLKELRYNIIK